MNIFGKRKENKADIRNKQFSNLQATFPSLRRLDEYSSEIMFIVSGQFQTLRIHVNEDFPNSKPGITALFTINKFV